jgi:cob(I)alamin adenosyltransferase
MARLTKIVTRTGDEGATGLAGGKRVSKDSPRIWAIGTIDELSSAIGVARAHGAGKEIDNRLRQIQNDLFNLGAELATPADRFRAGMPRIGERQLADLDTLIDELRKELGPLRDFILPGGNPIGAQLHVARTVCRRAERFCVRLGKEERIGEFDIRFLNRLSDALFMLARWSNKQAGVKETYWKKWQAPVADGASTRSAFVGGRASRRTETVRTKRSGSAGASPSRPTSLPH